MPVSGLMPGREVLNPPVSACPGATVKRVSTGVAARWMTTCAGMMASPSGLAIACTNGPTVFAVLGNGSGFVWGGGADVVLNDNWFLRGDLKKMDFDAAVNIETLGNVGNAEVNPLYLQLSVGYQF